MNKPRKDKGTDSKENTDDGMDAFDDSDFDVDDFDQEGVYLNQNSKLDIYRCRKTAMLGFQFKGSIY